MAVGVGCILAFGAVGCAGNDDTDTAETTSSAGDETTADDETTSDLSGDTEPYQLGFTGALTGPVAFAGVPQRGGFMTYIDHINASGGVDGRPIEVEVFDDQADGATAIANYERLARDFGALGVFGFSGSGAWSAAGAIAEEVEVVQIGISGVDQWVEEYHPYLFKAGGSQATGATIQMDFIESLADGSQPTIGVLALDTASGVVFQDLVAERVAERGWEIVVSESVGLAAADCTSQAASIVDADPDFVLSNMTNSGEDIVCAQAILDRGFEGSIVNNFQSPSDATIKRLESPQFYSQRSFVWPEDTTVEAAQEMVGRAEEYGYAEDIDAFFADGYVAGMFMVEALRRCGEDCSPQTYRDALESISTLDTGGLAGPNAGFVDGPRGHELVPDGIIVTWDEAAGEPTTVTEEWICGIPGRCG